MWFLNDVMIHKLQRDFNMQYLVNTSIVSSYSFAVHKHLLFPTYDSYIFDWIISKKLICVLIHNFLEVKKCIKFGSQGYLSKLYFHKYKKEYRHKRNFH